MCVGRRMIHKPKIFMIESLHYRQHELGILDILFLSNRNIHKSSSDHCFWASYHSIDGFYLNHSIKWSTAQKQRSDELLWMLWFDEKSISKVSSILFIWDLRPLVCACLFMPWSWRGKLIALQSFLSLSREWHIFRSISSRWRWLYYIFFFLAEIEFVVASLGK